MSDLPLLILSLGGTIAMLPGAAPGVVPTLTAEALVASVPALAEFAPIEAQSFRLLPSAHISLDDLEALAALIRERAEGLRGVVITQGTDTIEETAFALDLMLDLDIPVIVTGAMRNPSLPGADGPANLLAGVQTASDPALRGFGVMVVMNDEIHAARSVCKRHASSTAAFVSPNGGPLGWISEGRALLHARPLRALSGAFTAPSQRAAKVALLTIGIGDQGELVEACRAAGFDGIVLAGAGGGHVTPACAKVLAEAAREMPVVLTSRTGGGAALQHTYGYPGAEIELLGSGLIPGGALDPLKARILLLTCLRHGYTGTKIAEVFAKA